MPALLKPVARYTRFVLVGKRALWALAGLLVCAIVGTVWFNSTDDGSRIVFSGDEAKEKPAKPDPASMLRPRYQGVDADNRPFNVIAERAVQRDENTVVLEKVSADMTMQDSAWLALNSGLGTYDMSKRTLLLSGGVNMFYEGGYEFRTDNAFIVIDEGTARGDTPVEGQGPTGTLKAKSFELLDHGERLLFKGDVKMTLFL